MTSTEELRIGRANLGRKCAIEANKSLKKKPGRGVLEKGHRRQGEEFRPSRGKYRKMLHALQGGR